jgi:hypothetical protein
MLELEFNANYCFAQVGYHEHRQLSNGLCELAGKDAGKNMARFLLRAIG